jgi:hypothetical protein
MAKVRRIPLGGEPGTQKIEIPDRVSVELASLAGKARQGLLAFAVGVGLQVFHTLLEEDVAHIAGPKDHHDPVGRVAYRRGDQESSVTLGGRKVAVTRPRVRGVAGGEVALPTRAAFAGEELLCDQTMAALLAGVSTRNYERTLEPVGDDLSALSTSKSAASRRFVARTATALAELMAADLSDRSICALFADGIEEGDHMMVCAIGVDTEGRKHLLGLREGTTENRAVCASMLSDLVGRGLDFSRGILCVIDGGKGLRAAVREVFGSLGLVHRCRIHKRRNVLDHLPKETQPVVGRKLDAALGQSRSQAGPGRPEGGGHLAGGRPPRGGGLPAGRHGGDPHRHPPRPSPGADQDPVVHQPHRVSVLRRPGGDGQGEAVAGRGDGGALDGRRDGGRPIKIPQDQRVQRTANSDR